MTSVVESEIMFYGAANMPDADGATIGGAVDTSKLVFFGDVSPSGTMDYVSSNAGDTAATIALTGRNSTGAIVSENKTFNGTTPVTGSQSFERLLKGVIGGTTAAGDLAAISHTSVVTGTAQGGGAASGQTAPFIQLQSGHGASVAVGQIVRMTNNLPSGVQNQLKRIVRIAGDFAYVDSAWSTVPTSSSQYSIHQGMKFDKAPNQVTQVRRAFYNAAADVPGGSSRDYYEKVFAMNNSTTTALTAAAISKQTDPGGGSTFQFAACSGFDDNATAANRQTLPTNQGGGALTFTTGAAPQSQNVPGSGNLAPGAAPNHAGALGIWLKLTLPAGTAGNKSSADLRAQGSST